MNFLEYLISIYDNRDKEENLEKKNTFSRTRILV